MSGLSGIRTEHVYDIEAVRVAEIAAEHEAAWARVEAEQAALVHAAKSHTTHLDRRTILRNGGLVMLATTLPGGSFVNLLETAGATYDQIASPESIIGRPVTVLEPRRDNRPVVDPKPRNFGATDIKTEFSTNGQGQSVMRLIWDKPFQAEHTGTKIDVEPLFEAGEGIITTAEGLKSGKQEYCAFYRNGKQVIAVGYEGGLYVYEPKLGGSNPHQSRGEWVRIVSQDPNQPLPSRIVAHDAWKHIEATRPESMLVQRVVTGTETLASLGYKPFGAVLPSTRMPGMKSLTIGPDICAQTLEEVLAQNKRLLVDQSGNIIDPNHYGAKAGETLDLIVRLVWERMIKRNPPTATIPYALGSNAEYNYTISPGSIEQDDDLYDTVFALMSDVSTQMEGVSQTYIEEVPGAQKFAHVGNFDPDDLSTNTRATLAMIRKGKDTGLIEEITALLQTLPANTRQLSNDNLVKFLEKKVADIRNALIPQILTDLVREGGIRKLDSTATYDLPLGLYHLIPTKMRDIDAATPTFLDTEPAGVNPHNHRVAYKATHVPGMEVIGGRIGSEIQKKFSRFIGKLFGKA